MINKKYNFKSFKQLQEELERTKMVVYEDKAALFHNVLQVKEKLTASNIFKSLLGINKAPGIKRSVLGSSIGLLTNVVLGKRLGLLGRILLPTVSGNIAAKMVDNEESLINIGKKFIGLFRKKTTQPGIH